MGEQQSELGAPASTAAPEGGQPWGPYLITLAQLVGAGAAIHLLELEQRAGLPELVMVIVAAFAIHARAPMRLSLIHI